MGKQTIRKYKRELQQKVKTLLPGERHKVFDYSVFVELPEEWKVKPTTPLEVNEIRTAICYASDIKRNFLEYYILTKVQWEYDWVECVALENKSQRFTFYTDAVAIIPLAIIPTKIRLELLKLEDLHELEADRKRRRQEDRHRHAQKIEAIANEINGVTDARGTGSADTDRPLEEVGGMETPRPPVSRPEMAEKATEDGSTGRVAIDVS